MTRRRAYIPFPGAPAPRHSRREDAAERDIQAAARLARNIEIAEKRAAAGAEPKTEPQNTGDE